MATKSMQSIAQQLNEAQLTIANSLGDPQIQARVAGFGYPPEKLESARALYEAAQAVVNLQKSRSGDQQQATSALKASEAAARDAYQSLAQVARAVFLKDRATLTMLGLTSGRTPANLAGFLAAAHTLFDNASALTLLADYGYDAARLASERLKITALEDANMRQEAAKGASQQATVEQDAALRSLHEWLAQYRKIARVALRDQKQLLEKLGMRVRASRASLQE